MEGSIDYGGMLRRALRGMVREALEMVARDGLPGEHHFLLSFSTAAPGVELPAGLRAVHPERMTVVLQHQFWDLEVDADRFSVTLRFGGQQQRIGVPFDALLAFADPSVGLELAFDSAPASPPPGGEQAEELPGPEGGDDAGHRAEVLPFDPGRRR